MSQVSCGTVLRKAREKKGYDLDTVARRLRIRPDILRAIENDDFSSMPPRGYTRNMINAYARLLGLNPTETVNMYLDDAYANQIKRSRNASPAAGNFVIDGGRRRPRLKADTRSGSSRSEHTHSEGIRQSSRVSSGERDLYDDRTEYARRGYGVDDGRRSDANDWRTPGRTSRKSQSASASRSSMGARQNHDRLPSQPSERGSGAGFKDALGAVAGSAMGALSNRSARRSAPSYANAGGYGSMYSGRGGSRGGGIVTHLPLIIAAAIVLIVLIIVLSVVIGSRGNAQTDVSTLPVTGISDTTTDEDAEETPVVELAPTSAVVKYTVKNGQSAYLEIYTDGGDAEPLMLTGPTSATVEVTGTWTITTWAKDAITVTVDGETVDLQSNSDYGGMYAYTVDFNKILDEWNAEHPSTTSSSSSSSASEDEDSSDSSSSSSSRSSSSSSSSSVSSSSSN